MLSSDDHLSKAKHNEEFYSSLDLDTTSFLDWAVNGIFYSALHYVDSYFALSGDHPGDHGERFRLIRTNSRLGQNFFINLYRPLKDDSEEGRYDVRIFTPDEVRNDIIPLLEAIKQHLKHYIPQMTSP